MSTKATKPTYEEARRELVEVVGKLESGGTPLAESLALWERGEALAAICREWLTEAQAKVEAARPQGDEPADR